ncbi:MULTISPECIES: M48 family metallopeptidase [Calothrix]|uniref:M48 family metalloprotease n=2 Tax=Calothrix TaxID=1186 RepID=A0ABR8AI15_9CYAN|nr:MULTISPECIES: M48 family metallopeptidase [Calothrix]MBD2199544.1 M48 family metalloprotease [Calothrix parietina FACHB-288]MBD2228303.1 M48 family metalloprotease [Calothrix anomala FACHB-343]
MSNSLSSISFNFYRRCSYLLLSGVVAVSVGVASPQKSEAISLLDLLRQGVQIYQLSNISDSEEVQLGKEINQQLVNNEIQLYRDSNVNNYVNQIGQWLAANSTRPNIPYTFQIVKDNSINAFATMGGYVYVTTGLLEAADNEAQLASVIAHEIGHIASRHAIEQMRQTAIARGLASATGLDRSTAVQIGVDLALQRPNSRQDEFEADQRGLRTLGRAGYAQSAMIAFMQKLLNQPTLPTFLSTHPATTDRIAALRRELASQQTNLSGGLNNSIYREKIQPLS